MSQAAKIDFSLIPTIDIARELFGPEGRERTNGAEKHFPGHAGLFVNVEKNKWFSHGNSEGGDAASLVRFATNCDFQAAVSWLRLHGYIDRQAPQKRIVATYDYTDERGKLLYQVVRYDPKGFSQRRSDGNGGWIWKGPEKAVPYRLPDLPKEPDNRRPVLICAGEKDVDNVRALGFTATTNHGGEGKWPQELTPYFKGHRVFILVDNDQQGEKHQAVVGEALQGVASEIKVVRFPHLKKGGDVSDYIEQRRHDRADGATIEAELKERFRNAPAWVSVAMTSVTNEWPEPVSLPEGLSPVDTLDLALLPEKIAPWVGDISERMQCPPDYVGITALVALGAVLGRKIGIAPEQQTDWFEVPNNWGCIVGRPGDLKSPAIAEALKPLHRLEVDARTTYDTKQAEYQKAWQLWKLRKDAAESKAKKELQKNPDATLQFDAAEPEEPAERRYVTNDTTYEKLGEILAQNPNGVLAHRDELVSLLKTLDREEYAAARGFFLTAWNGKDRYTFDRIMRGKTHIEAACVSVLGSTQPGRLAEYVRRAVSGGAADDGLIQRFGLLVWPDQSPEWESIDRYPNSDARNAAWEVFENFEGLDPGGIGAEPTSQFQSVPVLRFDAEAHDLFLEWRKDLERKLRSDDLHQALASHFAKYRKLVPTLALINHLADKGSGAVSKAAMVRALGLATYLESHARRAYGAGPEAETAAAKAILLHIRKGDLENGFSVRDVHQHKWSRLTEREDVQAGLDLLCDLDWIAEREVKHAGAGRPTANYLINPGGIQ